MACMRLAVEFRVTHTTMPRVGYKSQVLEEIFHRGSRTDN